MSTRRKTPKQDPNVDRLTLVDEMMASPTAPMPAADAANRAGLARMHLDRIRTLPNPTTMDWRVVAMVGNVVEVMVELKFIDDPDGLLMAGQGALQAAAERAIERDIPIRFTGDELRDVSDMIDGFEDILGFLSHRKVVRACRETEKRMILLDQGKVRPTDYIARRRPAADKGEGGAHAV